MTDVLILLALLLVMAMYWACKTPLDDIPALRWCGVPLYYMQYMPQWIWKHKTRRWFWWIMLICWEFHGKRRHIR